MALQMGTCVATCTAWFCCSTISSLLSSCCGNDKSSTTPAGPTSGRKRSVFLLFTSVCLQFVFQFGLAPYILDHLSSDNAIRKSWLDGCEFYNVSSTATSNATSTLQQSCAGNTGSYRVAATTTLFFTLGALIAAFCKPTANREAWPLKIILYLALLAGTIIVPNDPIFTPIYRSIATVGGALFICMQQLVILDCSYNWNDSWVEKSNKAELEKSGSGRKWLASILVFSAIFFVGAFGGLIYMFFEFTGCVTNNLFISLTLIFCVALPIAQMAGGEGSLLSVACISAWATYLCYTAVSKNPDASCNPRFGDSSPISIAFGLAITLLSLAWAGWSYTAEDKLTDHTATNANDEPTSVKTSEEELEDGIQPKRAVTGVVVMQSGTDTTAPDEIGNNNNVESTPTDDSNTESVRPSKASNAWKLNVALAVVSCWSAMTLTQWGVIQSKDGTIANRDIGNVGMWVIIGSQWFVLTLYLWTLVAPRLFPDRDFS